jgi:hypothetical protein
MKPDRRQTQMFLEGRKSRHQFHFGRCLGHITYKKSALRLRCRFPKNKGNKKIIQFDYRMSRKDKHNKIAGL